MKPEEYNKRFYRNWQNPQDLTPYKISYFETDLVLFSKIDISQKAIDLIIRYRKQIEETIKRHPFFQRSLHPIKLISKYKIVRKMIEKSALAGVGPMASVAGALSEFAGTELLKYTDEIIIENGGDIFMKTNRDRILLVYAGISSPFKDKIRLKLKGKGEPYGICTSSRSIGHSLSFGNTDATIVIANSAITADAFATAIGNMVKVKDDIEKAINFANDYDEISGGLILLEDKVGAWGDIELV